MAEPNASQLDAMNAKAMEEHKKSMLRSVKEYGLEAFIHNLCHTLAWAHSSMEKATKLLETAEEKIVAAHQGGMREAAKIAENVGRLVGAGDNQTRTVGTSLDAARAILAAADAKGNGRE